MRPAKIVYNEVEYNENKPYWNDSEDYDTVDFEIDIHGSKGECITIAWGAEFYQYGVSIRERSAPAPGRPWDVTDQSKWRTFIGREITGVEVFWSWAMDMSTAVKSYYPQDIEIRFEGDQIIYISAFEIREGCGMGLMDNLTVFFDDAIASRFKIGHFAKND
ncbi:MAG: hypothetical protein ACSHX8_09925 [Opitutaceae bacterium]